ncbi:MAG: insulinase family protein [Acidaminococcaceae bacterium]|nr:insulinase family protein [Acidaminococcaceae bacterium]
MKLSLNKEYFGFIVKEATYIQELHSDGFILKHQKSGARLLYLGNTDDNKVFSISFRTPPHDDTGIAHILEHSVLCGSRKYRLKEPFVELVKGSMNTFLNAMTFPDKTMYPVASRNAKDFQNLMDVYLDAVFYPMIYDDKYTFLQEGWHYSLADEDSPLVYNGVVYNEMKGVFSSPEALIEYETMKALFPDSPYGYESGGHPDAITSLTQEEFLNFHRKYYAPENSYIYLYGDLDILETLEYLDREYLSAFAGTNGVSSEIPKQAPFARTKEVEGTYDVAATESPAARTYHELHIVTGEATDIKTNTALRLLESVLLESDSAPLKNALLEAKVGMDVSGSYSGSYLQPIFSIKVAGSEPELRDKFISTTYRILQELTMKGIDKELLEASLNSFEFKVREADFGVYPKGLIFGIGCMDTWLYGGNPFDCLRYETVLAELRNGISSRYYEQLIENYLLDNTHKVIATLKPETGREEREVINISTELEAIKQAMSSDEISFLIEQTHLLREKQEAQDEPSALAAIPVLKRSDLNRKIDKLPVQMECHDDRTHMFLPAETKKIVYLNWYFDISGIKSDMLPYAYLLSDILGKVDAGNYSYQALATAVKKNTGGIGFNLTAYSSACNADEYSICFVLEAKVLIGKLEKLFHILKDMAASSDFSNENRILEIVNEIKTDWDTQFFNRGQSIASTRLCSYFSGVSAVNEYYYLTYYDFIKKITANFHEQFPEIRRKLEHLLKECLHSGKQLFAYSCEDSERQKVKMTSETFVMSLPSSDYAGKEPEAIKPANRNEGISTSGKVQYVAAGGNFRQNGHAYTGAMKVLETILRYDYLWNRIRVQGGAYGANAHFNRNGICYFTSYRDPHLARTLEVYKETAGFLELFSADERELTKYVIGTVSSMDTPLTNSMRLEKAAILFIKNISDHERQKEREEVLDVTNEDIRQLGQVVKAVLEQDYYCVVGSKPALLQNKEIFSELLEV